MRHPFIVLILCSLFFLAACDEDSENEFVASPSPVKDSILSYFPADGTSTWEKVTPDKLGWQVNFLQEAIDFAKEKNSYSLIILHKGRIVSENYWQDKNEDSLHQIESVAKSMVSFQIGKLEEQGKLKITEPVSQYVGDGWSKAPLQKEKTITIKHLLTMSSGLDSELNYLADPGRMWYYSNEAFAVLFKIIEAATGQLFPEFFEQTLFSKIKISNYEWHGIHLAMTARDMARFGLLIGNKGMWNGERLLQEEGYFRDMLSSSQNIQKAYGYLWWLNGQSDYFDDKVTNGNPFQPGPIYPAMPPDALLAMGHFDQRIEIIPSLDLIIIRQGGDTGLPELGQHSFDNEFWSRLMKAIKNNGAG